MKLDNHTILGCLILVVTGGLVALGKLSADQWTSTAQVILVTLVGGNAITHTATQLAARGLPTATAVAPPDPRVPMKFAPTSAPPVPPSPASAKK